ncbi:hypothetical protein JCM6882_004209 [Rhodosporidiobolus microsporus]
MVYYVCPNCGTRSDEYGASMVHYNACDVVRVRNVSSPTNSTIASGGLALGGTLSSTSGGGGDAGAGEAGGAGAGGGKDSDQVRTGQAGVLSQRVDLSGGARAAPPEGEQKKQ